MPEKGAVKWRWAAVGGFVLVTVICVPYFAARGFLGSAARKWIARQQIQHRFDRIFQGGEVNAPFRIQPNAYMVRMLERRPPGRALDVAMGQGRNALWLASKGWDVTGFDISEAGLASAVANAKRQGLNLNAVRNAVEDFDYGHRQWDLVLLIYAPVPFDSPAYMQRIRDSLKPGGVVVVEGQIEWSDSRSEPRPPGALAPGELQRIFSDGYRILDFHEVQGVSEWFPRLTLLGRLTAQRE
jgi:SAM-dependent methyltransferase